MLDPTSEIRPEAARVVRPHGAVFATRQRARGVVATWLVGLAVGGMALLMTSLPGWFITAGLVLLCGIATIPVRDRWTRVRLGRGEFVIDRFDRWFRSQPPTEEELFTARGHRSARASYDAIEVIDVDRAGDVTLYMADGRVIRVVGRGLSASWMTEIFELLRRAADRRHFVASSLEDRGALRTLVDRARRVRETLSD
ncbi:MAG: hypothetical protein AAGA48_15760 [Myxococcota bacterium]